MRVLTSFLALTCGAPLLGLTGCSAEPKVIHDCVARDGVHPICGFQNPEDLAGLPGGQWLAVSQYGGPESKPGSLVAYRIADGKRVRLFPGDDPPFVAKDASNVWGAKSCPGPPDSAAFSPHGIDVDTRSRRLAAVNHGGREAIELFRVGRSVSGPTLEWRGCIPLPEGVLPNDVVLLADGRVYTTKMMATGTWQLLSGLGLMLGLDSGVVLAWSPGDGWREVAGTEGSGPNGLAVAADGSEIYVAEWGGKRLIRLRRGEGQGAEGGLDRETIELPHHPDNITWTGDGRLLVTGQRSSLGEVLACGGVEAGTCALPFSVVLVDPASLEVEVVLDHEGTAMGAGTVAFEVGTDIFVGTFAGDRISRARFRD